MPELKLVFEPLENSGEFTIRAKKQFKSGGEYFDGLSAPFLARDLLDSRAEVVKALARTLQQPDEVPLEREVDADDGLKRFGSELYDRTFGGGIRPDLNMMLDAGQGNLRIRLQLPPILRELPWELMRRTDTSIQIFLCQDSRITLIRSDSDGRHLNPVAIQLPLQVLVVVCSPLNCEPVGARKEVDLLLEPLAQLIKDGRVQVHFAFGPDTLTRIQRKLRGRHFHILHFIGHGLDNRGQVCLAVEDAQREAQMVPPETLWAQFQNVEAQMVVLNVCGGAKVAGWAPIASLASAFLQTGVPAVVAHQFEVSVEAGARFAGDLYRLLAEGLRIDEAVAGARRGLRKYEWATPVPCLNCQPEELFNVNVAEAVPPVVPDLIFHEARILAGQPRWGEEASYARETLLIDPDHERARALLERATEEEEAQSYLHEARFGSWAERIRWCEKYEKHPALQRRPVSERSLMARLKQAARAGAGGCDPRLVWRG